MKTLNLYAAVWDACAGPASEVRHGMSSEGYQSALDELSGKGYRLKRVSGYLIDNRDHYAAIWEHTSGAAWHARHRLSSDQLQHALDEFRKQGYRLRLVSGYSVRGEDLYAALWDKEPTTEWQARHRLTSDEYRQTAEQMREQGYRLTWVSTYEHEGTDHYAAIWDKSSGPEWRARHGMTPSEYQSTFDAMSRDGFRPICLSACSTRNHQTLFAALWQKRSGSAWAAQHALTSGGYQYTLSHLHSQGYQLISIAGYGGTEAAIAGVNLKLEKPLQSDWCWAAATVSVARYYDANSAWTQGQMVHAQAGRTGCSQLGNSKACNQTGVLDDALSRCGHLSAVVAEKASIQTLISQLSINDPVGIRIGWRGGGGHFILACGAELPGIVLIDDPIHGRSAVNYDSLANDYRGSGSWTHSYYTKP
jgi:polyglycine hydrolase-like protein/papain like cysteine protease AvrRpt2